MQQCRRTAANGTGRLVYNISFTYAIQLVTTYSLIFCTFVCQTAMARIENDRDLVSLREYYAYKLQMRDDNESFLLHFAQLLQQYIADMYFKLESQRLDFFLLQQEEIRKEFLQGVVDSMAVGES